MDGTSWLLSSVLAVVLGAALAAPVGAATPDAWSITKTRLALQIEQAVQGFPAAGRREARKWPRVSLQSWCGSAMRAPRHICVTVRQSKGGASCL
jgi:hypothetical protein